MYVGKHGRAELAQNSQNGGNPSQNAGYQPPTVRACRKIGIGIIEMRHGLWNMAPADNRNTNSGGLASDPGQVDTNEVGVGKPQPPKIGRGGW